MPAISHDLTGFELLQLALPLILATVSLWLTGRTPRGELPSGGTLVFYLWFLVSLPLDATAIYRVAGIEGLGPTSVDVGAASVVVLALLFGPRRIRIPLLWLFASLASIWILGSLAYFRYFGEIVSLGALRLALQVPTVSGSLFSLLFVQDFLLVLDLVPAGLAALMLAQRFGEAGPVTIETDPAPSVLALGQRRKPTAVILALMVLPALISFAKADRGVLSRRFQNRLVVENVGLAGLYAIELTDIIDSLRSPGASEQRRAEISDWFAARASFRALGSSSFGIAAGKNLIFVQAESLQHFCLDLEVDGQPVMPFLRSLRDHSIEQGTGLGSVVDQTHIGRTSDSEMAVLTSVLPVSNRVAAFRYDSNDFVSLPRVLARNGYTSMSAVPFASNFWNRRKIHASYGFDHSYFVNDFEPGLEIGWGLNDRAFLSQAVDKLERLPRPFFAFLVTLGLHHPYGHFPDQERRLRPPPGEPSDSPISKSLLNYLEAMHFLDRALEDFVAKLTERGLREQSILVIYGDHDAGFGTMKELSRLIRGRRFLKPHSWRRLDSMPLVLSLPEGMLPVTGDRTETAAIERTGSPPAGLIDLAPTVLPLLGVDIRDLPLMGRNLLANAPDSGSATRQTIWIDDHSSITGDRLYLTKDSSAHTGQCLRLYPATEVGLERCRDMIENTAETLGIAADLLRFDLQGELAAARIAAKPGAAEPEEDVLIAHALGGVAGKTYTNSLQALRRNYRRGMRWFEVDLALTADGDLVCFHEQHEDNLVATRRSETVRGDRTVSELTTSEFLAHDYGDFSTLSLKRLAELLQELPDAYLVSDTKQLDPVRMAALDRELRDPDLRSRVMVQIYQREDLALVRASEALHGNFGGIIFTLYQTPMNDAEVLQFVEKTGVRFVTASSERITAELTEGVTEKGGRVFVHTVNTHEQIERFRKLGASGFYTDFVFQLER